MAEQITIKNTDILLKYINCIERVLFVDNRWMKDYDDLKNKVDREYEGVSLFLKEILDYFDRKEMKIFFDSLPDKEFLERQDNPIQGIILESLNNFTSLDEGQEYKQYVVIACPKVERVFHFKTNQPIKDYLLEKAEIKDFSWHPNLPRIKIYSKKLMLSNSKAKLSDLRFIYTLPSDADKQIKNYKEINGKMVWDELIPDPACGVQIGNLGVYYISPTKVIEVKRDIENIREQIILVIEDWKGKKFEYYMKPLDYKKITGEFAEEKILKNPFYLRALVFQGFSEGFRHILFSEKISEKEFNEDSIISYIRFRKVLKKENFPGDLLDVSDILEEKDGYLYYFPEGFKSEIFDATEKFNSPDKFSVFAALKKYHEFQKLYKFHPEWKEIYEKKISADSFYKPLNVLYPNPWSIPRSFLQDPIQRLAFFAKNKRLRILCTDCFGYKDYIKTKDIPSECPICHSKTFVSLEREEDEILIKKNMESKVVDKKFQEYMNMSSWCIKFSKFLFYTLNFTGYAPSTCIQILNELECYFDNENIFFEKLYKISQVHNRKGDIYSIIYKLNKEDEA